MSQSSVAPLEILEDAVPALGQPAPLVRSAARGFTARRGPLALPGIYAELAKARLSALVVITAGVGFALASPLDTPRAFGALFATLLGTALAAFGANALNQVIEHERDARMARTSTRPLPAGRIARPHALIYGLLLAIGGPALLWLQTNTLTASLAALCVLIYVLLYTPLKPVTPLNTLIGAVCGALPPMLGWTAASGLTGSASLDAPAWTLGAILFFWQIPHSLALAWLYREDYERGGFRMLPSVDPSGRLTCQATVIYSLALLPLGLLLTVQRVCGPWYAAGSLLAGGLFVLTALLLYRRRDRAAARRVFFASIIYLPVLLALMVFDRLTRF